MSQAVKTTMASSVGQINRQELRQSKEQMIAVSAAPPPYIDRAARSRHSTLCTGLCGNASKHCEQTAPVAFDVEDAPHLVATCSVSIEPAMLELNARHVLAVWNEPHFDFGLQRWIRLPVGTDVPRQHQTRWRLP